MANATPVTATTEADETQNTEATTPATADVEITEVKGKAPAKPKAVKAKEVSKDFTHGIQRETF